jgi:hypothetical protein
MYDDVTEELAKEELLPVASRIIQRQEAKIQSTSSSGTND